MPRRFGYIIVAVAVVLGVGALVLPLPDQVELTKPEAPPAAKAPRPSSAPAVPSRSTKKPVASAPPQAKAPAAAREGPAPFPMQDTTKTRTLVQPPPSKPKE